MRGGGGGVTSPPGRDSAGARLSGGGFFYAQAGLGSTPKPRGCPARRANRRRPARPCARQPVRASAPRRWRPERRRGTSGSRRAPGACLAADPRPRHTDVNRSARPAPRGPRPPPPRRPGECGWDRRAGQGARGGGGARRSPPPSSPCRPSALRLGHVPPSPSPQSPQVPGGSGGSPVSSWKTKFTEIQQAVPTCPAAGQGLGWARRTRSSALNHPRSQVHSHPYFMVGKTEAAEVTGPRSHSQKATRPGCWTPAPAPAQMRPLLTPKAHTWDPGSPKAGPN